MAFFKKALKLGQKTRIKAPNKETELKVISSNVAANLEWLTRFYNSSTELVTSLFRPGEKELGLAYLDSYIDKGLLQQLLISLEEKEKVFATSFILGREKVQDYEQVIRKFNNGYVAFFVEGEKTAYLIPLARLTHRALEQPSSERSPKGPQDDFVEDLATNLYLIRSKLHDQKLRIREIPVGTRSQSMIHVLYIEDLAQREIVDSLIERIEAIKTDGIFCCSQVVQYIEDSWLSPFPQLEYTQRPDVVSASLIQGRVALLHPTSPGIYLAPVTFFDLLDTPEDYYHRWSISASIIRFIRILAVFFATFLPSFYIALTAYNPEFIPTHLTFIIAASREGVPFPTPVEAFFIVSIVEFTREAVLRLPTIEAQITGIVGLAAIIGSVIYIGMVSAPMVIVIGFAIICASTIPDYDFRISIRELMFFFMLMASFLGIFGVAMAFFYATTHMVVLKSFGIPFMSPAAPLIPKDWFHLLFRLPAWALPRLKTYHSQDSKRQEYKIDQKGEVLGAKKKR